MESFTSNVVYIKRTFDVNEMRNSYILKGIKEALSPIYLDDIDEKNISFDTQNNSDDTYTANTDITIISSHTNCEEFTQRLNKQIQLLYEQETNL